MRKFDIGRQDESLLNDQFYALFEAFRHYLNSPSAENPNSPSIDTRDSQVRKNALWIDSYSDPANADLRYFNGTEWALLFGKRFKITQFLTSKEQPSDPVEGQLWIDDGILKYYKDGQFKSVKATPYDSVNNNPIGYQDFLIISPMEHAKQQVIDNFSDLLFANGVNEWKNDTKYTVDDGITYDLHIYKCIKAHTSSPDIPPTNKEYWLRLDWLSQFLVPNSFQDKFYINGEFVHTKQGWKLPNGQPDPSDDGYSLVTNCCVTFPLESVNGKTTSAVHVNPTRLNNVQKKFIKIDKTNPIIQVPEENTEYYAVQGGIGKLLIKSDNEFTTDYTSVISNDIKCIKLSKNIANNYDFIYAIHYEFTTTNIRQPGTLYKKKFKLQDDNYVWIGQVNPEKMAVFAQGLFYEKDDSNYVYNAQTGYLYIKEKLQNYDNIVKTFDFSVLSFPNLYQVQVPDLIDSSNGARIDLPEAPKSKHLIAFVAGIETHMDGIEVLDDPNGDPRVKYLPSVTQKMFDNSPKGLYWAIAELDEYDSENKLIFEMYRGKGKAIKDDIDKVIIPIYRDKSKPVAGACYLAPDESPILFVDGILTFQKEIEIDNDSLTIYGLKEGQEYILLADTKTNQQSEYENSDRLIFEDTVSYATIPTELCDETLVYLQNGILCDASSVYTSIEPKDKGYHGEVRLFTNYTESKWMIYDAYNLKWNEIPETEMFIESNSSTPKPLTEILDRSARGYSATRKSISFLQNLGDEVCTYYAYLYSDSIEKPLLMDYCYPNGKDGINNDYPAVGEPQPFKVNYRHGYTPGKNELTVYLNGIRQNLDSPYDINHKNSKNKECRTDRNNQFTLAYDDGTQMGKAIPATDGYFVYVISKIGTKNKVINTEKELSTTIINNYKSQGYTVDLINKPTRNVIFYVIEQCESGENTACERKTLTYKDSLASKGAFSNNMYTTGNFLLTRGNIRVFINGIRQPYGPYRTWNTIDKDPRISLEAYRIIDATTIQIKDPLIGGMGRNEGDENNPLFPIGTVTENGVTKTKYYNNIDEIVIETRTDFKLREITVPIKDNSGQFTEADGLPNEIFKTKDKLMIYINGLAYGKEYKIENKTIKLTNEGVKQLLGNNKNDVITFEWR